MPHILLLHIAHRLLRIIPSTIQRGRIIIPLHHPHLRAVNSTVNPACGPVKIHDSFVRSGTSPSNRIVRENNAGNSPLKYTRAIASGLDHPGPTGPSLANANRCSTPCVAAFASGNTTAC